MKVRFWGVRGSTPSPSMKTIRYGGNTACIEIRGDENELLILDAGSGLRELGNFLLAYDFPKGSLSMNMLLSHTHWDHIQGFPFFAPLYIPSTDLTIYGPGRVLGKNLVDVFEGQMVHYYFPVHLQQLKAKLGFVGVEEEDFALGPFHVKTLCLNHPLPVLGYRIECQGKVFVSLFDHEYYLNPYVTEEYHVDPTLSAQLSERTIQEVGKYLDAQNQRVFDFARGADLVVHDAQYLHKEYTQGKIGWGHSYIEYIIPAMMKANVQKLALFHHDPMRTDAELHKLQEHHLNKISQRNAQGFRVFFARERLQIDL